MHNNVEKKIEFSSNLFFHFICYVIYFMNYWVYFDSIGWNKRSNLIYQKDPKLIENVIKNGIKIWATLDGTQRLEMFRR